jgi:Fur family ferric uptake transcriptional regulator
MTVSPASPALEFDGPETVLNAVRARGMRVSTARRVVVHTLLEVGRPVSADEIATGLNGRRPRLDVGSVYRNLETLEELGVVRYVHAGHGPGRYALVGAGEREYLACDRCRELVEVYPCELDGTRDAIRALFGFEGRFTHFPIVGLCSNCVEGGKH